MNHDLKKNKIFAAILIALLVVFFTSLIAGYLVQPKYLKENVYVIEVANKADTTDKPGGAEPEPVQDIMTLLPAADAEKGKGVVKKCVQCHTLDKDGPHRIGPNLWGVVGSKGASKPGYAYSQAANDMHMEWTPENLDKYLENPRKFMPGTKMSFIGLKKIKDRANLIAYLMTLKD